MIIDNVGEMAVLMSLAQESSMLSAATMNRIRELQEFGRADLKDDPAMRELLRRFGNMIDCFEMLSRRYPDIADEIELHYNAGRIQRRKRIGKSDSLLRETTLKKQRKCDKIALDRRTGTYPG